MKEIKLFEQVMETRDIKVLEGTKLTYTMFEAYKACKENGNERLNFSGVIWLEEIPFIVETCREYGIKEITISSTATSLLRALAQFEELGCEVNGLTKVKSSFKSWGNEDYDIVPAIVLTMPQ